jgi:hypothetical protein
VLEREGSRVWSAAGGVLVLGAAGVSAWQARVALAASEAAPPAAPPAASLAGPAFNAAAFALGALGLWLLVNPPDLTPRFLALVSAILAAGFPAALAAAPLVLPVKAEEALRPFGEAGAFLGAPAAEAARAGLPPAVTGLAAGLAVTALAGSVWSLFTGYGPRGKASAGYALALALLWGASLAILVATS